MYSRSGLVILQVLGNVGVQCVINQLNNQFAPPPRCEDSIGCMHGSSEPDLRNWKSPPPQFTQGARPD
ncbi:hypothetical protein, partial [Bordetella pertussis]